jgi:hypothetical protein
VQKRAVRLLSLGLCWSVVVFGCSRNEPPPTEQSQRTATTAPNVTPANQPPIDKSSTPDAQTNAPVGLDGQLTAISTIKAAPSRKIYSRSLRTWILESPKLSATKLGAFRLGTGLPVADAPAGNAGCPGGFYAVKPQGYVCRGEDATLDEKDPLVRIGAEYPADISRRLPYFYGTVRKPGPIYRKLPDSSSLQKTEPDLDKRMKAWLSAPGELGSIRVRQHRIRKPPGSHDNRIAYRGF